MKTKGIQTIGWREWVAFPDLGIDWIKAKVDTGAKTSAIHVSSFHIVEKAGKAWVKFVVHPEQGRLRRGQKDVTIHASAELIDQRNIRASNGHSALRPVVVTEVKLCGKTWPIELTLADRDIMGFRMLLGRQALRHRFWVDPASSFLGGRRTKKKKKVQKNKTK
jgi:hypothetical protein